MGFNKAQLEASKAGGVIDLNVDSTGYEPATMKNVGSALGFLAVRYSEMLRDELDLKDAASSGDLAESILPLAVEVNGKVFSVQIQTNAYASFIDEGVDGWDKSRGSKYSFKAPKKQTVKSREIRPLTPMQLSVKEWLGREGSSARNVKVGISSREIRGRTIRSAEDRAAITTAYMIKRFGIAPTHFWRDATAKFKTFLEKELGESVKIDIINSIVK